MADRLSGRLAALLAVVACVPVPVAAQSVLADPTRPPAGVFLPGDEPAVLPAPVLQSVLIPEKGTPSAVIAGHLVALGGRYGESRLVRVSEHEAVLDGPDGRTRLRLTPAVEKTNLTAPAKTLAHERARGRVKK